MRKRWWLIFSIVTLIFIVGCGSATENEAGADSNNENEKKESVEANADVEKKEKEAASELGDYTVQFSGEVIEEGDEFIVEGMSNLLPGSRIVGEVVVDEGETVYSNTSELVSDDGTFYMELKHHQYGEAEIIIRFDFDGVQEDEIKRHYGEKGQKLEGPFIYKHKTFDGILKKAEVTVNYSPDGENDFVLKAPDWYDLPEDYGDPRVWIEVEDITEDGEFFYLHGRSNILEGSEIRVQYKGSRGKTQVNPDGSFDFKFDYRYEEDEDIVITFEPSNFQWNEIEEAYGATGQKLVGNLVVQDKFNTNKQYIEKRIPWDNKSAMSSNRADDSNQNNNEENSPSEDTDNEDVETDEKDDK